MRSTPNQFGYLCFYQAKKHAVFAKTSFEAYEKAIEHFKAPKSKQYLVSVHLAEKNGQAVVHTADF